MRFEATKCENLRKSRMKCSFWCSNRSRLRVSGFPVASPCLWGEAAKPILFAGVKASCNVVLCGRRGTSWHFHVSANASKIVLCGKRNTFASLSKDDWQFSWQAQHFGDLRCHFARQARQFRRVVLPVFCKSHCQDCVKSWHSTLCNPHSTLYTLQFTLHTLHPALYTPHSTL